MQIMLVSGRKNKEELQFMMHKMLSFWRGFQGIVVVFLLKAMEQGKLLLIPKLHHLFNTRGTNEAHKWWQVHVHLTDFLFLN